MQHHPNVTVIVDLSLETCDHVLTAFPRLPTSSARHHRIYKLLFAQPRHLLPVPPGLHAPVDETWVRLPDRPGVCRVHISAPLISKAQKVNGEFTDVHRHRPSFFKVNYCKGVPDAGTDANWDTTGHQRNGASTPLIQSLNHCPCKGSLMNYQWSVLWGSTHGLTSRALFRDAAITVSRAAHIQRNPSQRQWSNPERWTRT
ncbi:hypothetical protein V8E55_007940 [Tylopilus felleus]